MKDNYAKITDENLGKIFKNKDAASCLIKSIPGKKKEDGVEFKAFGDQCFICPGGIFLGGRKEEGPRAIVISLYALSALSKDTNRPVVMPLKAFKDFPQSMPYVGAFASYTQNILIPFVGKIKNNITGIISAFGGEISPAGVSGDFSFMIAPLPKIFLCYIFYEADEDFPASVTCLFSNNAHRFLPMDGLADLGEYTSKKIIEILK